MYLIFDTETTGLPQNWKAPLTDFNNWPRCVQLAWQVHDIQGKMIEVKNYIIKPDGYDIPWDGTFNGNLVADGTYFYVINLNDSSEESVFKGSILVMENAK